MTYSDDIRKILEITDPNITFIEGCLDQDSITLNGVLYQTVSATLSYDPVACPCCHQKNINNSILKHGFKQVKVKYACSLACPKLILLKKQRFICKACKKTFMAQTNLVEPNCQISNLQKQLVKEQLRLVQSASLIAKNTYVSISTVVRVLDSLEKQMKPQTNTLPTTLSFDELRTTKSCKAEMSFIYANASTHQILDLLDSRQQADIKNHFFRFPLDARRQVEWITMDMNLPFISMIKTLFPCAKIVIDRFHIIQLLNRALNNLRIQVMNQYKKKPSKCDYNKLKKLWKLLLKNREDLDFENYQTHRLFDGLVTEKMMVEYLLSLDIGLRNAYEKINDFKYAIMTHDVELFHYELQEIKKYSYRQVIRTAFNTITRYQEYITNALTVTLSNGHLEATNNIIKTIKRTGHGYTNFRRLRLRARYILLSKNCTNQDYRPLYFSQEKESKTEKTA